MNAEINEFGLQSAIVLASPCRLSHHNHLARRLNPDSLMTIGLVISFHRMRTGIVPCSLLLPESRGLYRGWKNILEELSMLENMLEELSYTNDKLLPSCYPVMEFLTHEVLSLSDSLATSRIMHFLLPDL